MATLEDLDSILSIASSVIGILVTLRSCLKQGSRQEEGSSASANSQLPTQDPGSNPSLITNNIVNTHYELAEGESVSICCMRYTRRGNAIKGPCGKRTSKIYYYSVGEPLFGLGLLITAAFALMGFPVINAFIIGVNAGLVLELVDWVQVGFPCSGRRRRNKRKISILNATLGSLGYGWSICSL